MKRIVVFIFVKVIWARIAFLTHDIILLLLYGTLFKCSFEQSNIPMSSYSTQSDVTIRGTTMKKDEKRTNILTAMLST